MMDAGLQAETPIKKIAMMKQSINSSSKLISELAICDGKRKRSHLTTNISAVQIVKVTLGYLQTNGSY